MQKANEGRAKLRTPLLARRETGGIDFNLFGQVLPQAETPGSRGGPVARPEQGVGLLMIERTTKSAGEGFLRSIAHEQELGALLAAVDEFLSQRAIAGAAARRTRLVVEEIVANAFRHGGAAGAGGVVVELQIGPSSPTGSIGYAGPAFDPTTCAPVSKDEDSRVGGQGLPLIRGLTHRLKYERTGEFNQVEFEIATNESV